VLRCLVRAASGKGRLPATDDARASVTDLVGSDGDEVLVTIRRERTELRSFDHDSHDVDDADDDIPMPPLAAAEAPPAHRASTALALVATMDEEYFANAAEGTGSHGMQAVPCRLGDAARAELNTRKLEEAIAVGDIDLVIVRIPQAWYATTRTSVHPWGQPWASEEEHEAACRSNRLAALAIRWGIMCQRHGVPCLIIASRQENKCRGASEDHVSS